MVKLEVVCCSVEDCILATEAGADRIELCSALELGGLTPTPGMLECCKAVTSVPIVTIVRPRAGGFIYSAPELATMVSEAHDLIRSGSDGLVFGCLTPDSAVDAMACSALVKAATGKPCTFHRAFDLIAGSAQAAAADLARLGFARVLTSGQAKSATEGLGTLEHIVKQNVLEVIAAGGIRSGNVEEVCRTTGVSWIHVGPFLEVAEAGYQGRRARRLDADAVKAVRAGLARMSG